MKKKVNCFRNLKPGAIFKRKGKRTLYMKTNIDDAQTLTGKYKGKIDFDVYDNNESVTPTKVKISEVK